MNKKKKKVLGISLMALHPKTCKLPCKQPNKLLLPRALQNSTLRILQVQQLLFTSVRLQQEPNPEIPMCSLRQHKNN